jgi:dynein heavy chain
LPKNYKEISKFHKLMLYRAMRPDRVPSALNSFVGEMMDERYVEQPPFSIFETFA